MSKKDRVSDEPSRTREEFGSVPSVAVSTLKQLPYRCRCRVCRGFFRSERARVGYCPPCRQVIAERTRELGAILAAAEGRTAEIEGQAIRKVRATLRCPILQPDQCPCGWEGNQARVWPRSIPAIRESLPKFVERLQRHLCEHCFPGRFGWAAERRAEKQFERLCHLPEDRQPESAKLRLRTHKWLESQGITATVSWSPEEPPPKLLTKRHPKRRNRPAL